MGVAKAYMMEQEKLQDNGASVKLECPKCSSHIHEYCDIPYPNLLAEKTSEVSRSEDIEINCSHCYECFDAIITNDSASCIVELVNYEDYEIEVELPENYQDQFDYLEEFSLDYSETPELVFQTNYRELTEFINEHCHKIIVTIENRMAFIQAWAAFEAYLSDRLVSHLKKDDSALLRFAKYDQGINDLKLNPADMLAKKMTVEDAIIFSIKNRLFHNFDRKGKPCNKSNGVPKWYRLGMQLDIIPSLEDLDKLREFATLRHDCVHRNGKDPEENENTSLNSIKIMEALDLMNSIVIRIEDKLSHS